MNESNEYMSLSAAIAAKETTEAGSKAADRLNERAQSGEVFKDPDGPRSFITPTHPNTKFLVQKGPMSGLIATGGNIVQWPRREGDIVVKFTSGVCSTDDPIKLEWLEAHSGDPEDHREYHTAKGENARNCSVPIGLCRENGPGVDDWYKMKKSQIASSREKAGMDPDVDVDAIFRGEHLAQRKGSRPASERISAVAEANENAASDREDGNRN